MKKVTAYLLVALTLLSLTLTFAPHALAQTNDTSDLKVLNYSYQADYTHDILIVYGEVQNTGTSTLNGTLLSGSVYNTDGTDIADSSGYPISIYIVPGQKVPFEIDFNAPTSSADGTWFTASISRIDIKTSTATKTDSYPYPDVKVTSKSQSIDKTANASGTYWVSGTIKNTGSQIAQHIFVVATFYNSSGSTVSAGWSTVVTSLGPSESTSFQLGAFDINMSDVTAAQKITSYALTIRTAGPILQGNPPDASAYSPDASSIPSSSPNDSTNPTSNDQSSTGGSGGFNTQWLIYGAIIAIVIVAIAITVLRFPRRKTETKPKNKTAASTSKVPSKKPQGNVSQNFVSQFKY